MNHYQSALYQFTESVGAVSMVNVEQIKTQQNLDYLEHLCSFIDRMNINPIWFENEDNANKLKILEIYQLAITYSNNLSVSYQRSISEKEAQVKRLREAEKEKMRAIRNHKDDYQLLKQRYKLKKHQLYKFMYDNLRNKVRQEDSFRDTRRDREPKSEAVTPEIIYYYPNPNDPTNPAYQYPPYVPPLPQLQHPYDPRMWPQNQSHPPPPPPYANYPPGDGTNRQPPPQFSEMGNSKHPGDATNQLNMQQMSWNKGDSNIQYRQYLNEGSSNKPQYVSTHLKQETPNNIKKVIESDGEEEMQKSKIIASGQKFFEKIDQQIKLNTEKSLSKDSGLKKRESVRLDSREEDDDFGNLTLNSKKKDASLKLSKKDSITEDQEQFDSIAHIKLVTDSSAKIIGPTPNRFQSKIYGKEEKPIKPPTPKHVPEKSPESLTDNQPNEVSSIMQSTYSKNNPVQAQKLFDSKNPPPKRNNGQTIRNTNFRSTQVKEQNIQDIKYKKQSNQAESNKQNPKEPEKLFLQRPKRVNQETNPTRQFQQPSPRQNNQDPNERTGKNIDIYQSNVGRVQNKKEQIDIFTSNVGHGSGNSKDSQSERLLTQRPKRANQVQPSIPLPNKNTIPTGSNTLEVPQIKKSNNHLNQLAISVAESEEMKNSNMLYSQANSIKFSNSKQPGKTPPKLQKQIVEDEKYEDDFQIDDIGQLQKSRLPISQNKQQKPAQKSQVNIHISSIPTTKQIVKDKFASLPNQTFELKTNNVQPPNKNAASSNISESDNFFDEILEMPMNSKIAKRPEIHKFQAASSVPQRTSINTKQLESRKTLVGSGKIEEAVVVAGSPSIHLIGVDGHKQRLQQRGGIDRYSKQRMSSEQTPLFNDIASDKDRIDSSRSSELKQFNAESKVIGGKQTSLLDLIKRQVEKPEKIEAEQDGEINFEDLLEQSKLQPIKNPSKKQESKKDDGKAIRAAIAKIEAQPPAFKDPRNFDEGVFDRILKEQFKLKVADVRTEDKWESREKYYKDQCEKVKSMLENEEIQKQDRIKQEISRSERSERSEKDVQTPKSINRQSNYDDLQYSQSNLKIQNKFNNRSSTGQTDLIKSLADSITIQDPPKVEQKVTPKNAENKYSRSGKPKADIKGEITKNINLGKHDYDVDDPLNLAIIQNKQLLNDQEDSEFD